jgi:hypothetical protein
MFVRTSMNPIQPVLLLLLVSSATLSIAGTAAETAFLRSLITPALGTTPDDWIALLGEPTKKIQNFGEPIDEKLSNSER